MIFHLILLLFTFNEHYSLIDSGDIPDRTFYTLDKLSRVCPIQNDQEKTKGGGTQGKKAHSIPDNEHYGND